ncbi:tetratricopeptide repeat protein [Wohlfahrtiimonas chitiniclastica]|uniref:Ancillary SecYEG translocon subunit n=1 Tax=Wohlfahrtiimonas chitiniclastica SH04 TaxID=1261130 RepID=L8XYK0_9GAMM|nr:tetratricopeptide repeat protein [Wohlfahrtiimonas chitiniclastica]ELV07894.1 Hypothetical protein F387_00623 [Wohlfahrtiimonas chitiniclastica SH04]KZX36691.1 hypothetical protein A6V30_09900 [Wohlfahrtiimonas chitiniclastica]MBS7814575.1 tetratricopeptide repeat protein [Wohlfahrtiimonas chitiniclastica]MBS7818263.1 tetratricopeptide repeat protein [Wohlfahrtiimonas chitiniclastica]MBS7820466.1 tetratricopeptide repeat protein [Wohlfahrtiimonas chitiniclastica]
MSLNQLETDEQRAEALVDWLKANGGLIFLAFVVVIGGIIGWDYYRDHQRQQLIKEAAYYYHFEQALSDGKINDNAFKALQQDKATGFVELAVLQQAGLAASQDQLDQAIASLTAEIANIKEPVMKDLYRYRLAKALYAQGDYEKALNELSNIQTESYQGLVKALQGDVYVKEGRLDNARAVYQKAYELLQSPIIQRKINQLGAKS